MSEQYNRLVARVQALGFPGVEHYLASRPQLTLAEMARELGIPTATYTRLHGQFIDSISKPMVVDLPEA